MVSSVSYALLKNLNEPFYFFLQPGIYTPGPTLRPPLLAHLINRSTVSEGPL